MAETLPQSFYDAATAILSALGANPTPAGVNLLAALSWCEKPHTADGAWQWFNPLNTTQPEPGSYSVNSAGVQAYPSQQVGVQATVETLRNGYYPHLLDAVMSGNAAEFFGAPGEMATWGPTSRALRRHTTASGRLPFPQARAAARVADCCSPPASSSGLSGRCC